jgi:hypothetical protein
MIPQPHQPVGLEHELQPKDLHGKRPNEERGGWGARHAVILSGSSGERKPPTAFVEDPIVPPARPRPIPE